MSSSASKKKVIKEFATLAGAVIIILLSIYNIYSYFENKKVLGISTVEVSTQNTKKAFWDNFLSKNPDYIPGLIKMGEVNKAKQVDPNYIN